MFEKKEAKNIILSWQMERFKIKEKLFFIDHLLIKIDDQLKYPLHASGSPPKHFDSSYAPEGGISG